jgi:hypothetical protein
MDQVSTSRIVRRPRASDDESQKRAPIAGAIHRTRRKTMKIAQTDGDGFGDAPIAIMATRPVPQTAMKRFESKNKLIHGAFRHDRDHDRQHLPCSLISYQFSQANALVQPAWFNPHESAAT